jgi:hypothetical protein
MAGIATGTTAAVILGSSAVLGGGIAAAGSAGLFGGGGGGVNSQSISKQMEEYVAAIRGIVEEGRKIIGEAVSTGRGNTQAIADDVTSQVNTAGTSYRKKTNKFIQELKVKVGEENLGLVERTSALIDAYGGDVDSALNALLETGDRLNQAYAKDAGKIITDYGSIENALDQQLVARDEVSEAKYAQGLATARDEYRTETSGIIDRTEDRALSLGDRFLEQASANQQLYAQDRKAAVDEIRGATRDVDATVEASRALGFNMENAANFSQLADTLSKAAQQTRMDLLATADPRALELSAIADENAAAMMSGRISADVQANLARTGAVKALQGGFAGGDMQRNMEARDLGLTSLDLQQRGTTMYDAQRRLNYDTRVAGTQVNPFDVMVNNGLSSQQALTTATDNAARSLDSARYRAELMGGTADAMFNSRMGTAESDRNQRLQAINDAALQRLGTADSIFGSRTNETTNIFDKDTRLNNFRYEAGRDANVRGTAMKMAATQDIYNNYSGLSDTVFNTRLGAAQQKATVGLGTSDALYNTGINTANKIFDGRFTREGNIYANTVQTALTTGGWRSDFEQSALAATANYEGNALSAMSGALGSAAATNANLPLINAAGRNAAAMQNAQLWGSAVQSTTSLAGAFAGSGMFSPSARSSYGGGYNTYGGYNPASSSPYYGNVSSASARPVAMPT